MPWCCPTNVNRHVVWDLAGILTNSKPIKMLIDIGRYVGHHLDQVSANSVDCFLAQGYLKHTILITRFMWQTSSILLGLEYDDKWHIFSNHPTLLIFQKFIKLLHERALKEHRWRVGRRVSGRRGRTGGKEMVIDFRILQNYGGILCL